MKTVLLIIKLTVLLPLVVFTLFAIGYLFKFWLNNSDIVVVGIKIALVLLGFLSTVLSILLGQSLHGQIKNPSRKGSNKNR